MQVRPITFGSPAYEATLRLRNDFLRAPLGLMLTEADTRDDAQQLHFGIFNLPAMTVVEGSDNELEATDNLVEQALSKQAEGQLLVGSVIGMPLTEKGPTVVRIRQMVVHDMWRGKQLGRQLLLGAEQLLRQQGFKQFELFARPEASEFYERCDYHPTGESKELIGIVHQHFTKQLD